MGHGSRIWVTPVFVHRHSALFAAMQQRRVVLTARLSLARSAKSFFDELGEFRLQGRAGAGWLRGSCLFLRVFLLLAASFCSFFSLRFDSDSDLLRVSLFLKPFIILAARCVVLGERPIREG